MSRFPIVAVAWAAALAAGFAVVLLLGGPVASDADQLDAALHPSTPVTQAAAESVAATIVRLRYASYGALPRTVTKATDFGIDHWVIEYANTAGGALRGLRISIVIDTGRVEVNTFP